MKTFTILGAFGLAVTMVTTSVPESIQNPIQAPQSLSVPEYIISFDRGSYSILEADYDDSTILSDDELISILRMAGFEGEGLKMAWAIVFKESTNRPWAHNDNPRTGDNSYGLFQINMRGSMGPDRREKYGLKSNEDLYNPLINAKIAFQISDGGQSWGAWTTKDAAKNILAQFPGD